MRDDLIEVATSDSQWNGVAVSPGGRIFVSLPRWRESEDTFSVGEIKGGSLHPFPGGDWNTWHPTRAQANPQNRFVCVNAVHTDRNGSLWVVDAGVGGDFGENRFLPDGPKLVRFDLGAGATSPQVYPLGKAAPAGSYLNDVRIGTRHAYLTESGLGAIIVLDLKSGKPRRLLAGHPSTQGDPGSLPVVGGKPLLGRDGKPVVFKINALELTPDEEHLLYQPIGGPAWFRIATAALLDSDLPASQLSEEVKSWHTTMPLGGTTMDNEGNIYLGDVEGSAIRQQRPDGTLHPIVTDPRLTWPDASDIGPDDHLYIPVSQLHRMPQVNRGIDELVRPFKLFKVKIPR
jgi:sugar lactone lactonase YvrE